MSNRPITPPSPGPEPASPLTNQVPDSICKCDYPVIAEVWSDKWDEYFYFYRRCPVHSKVKHIMEIETLTELKKLGYSNLTNAGKEWLKELEEKEKSGKRYGKQS